MFTYARAKNAAPILNSPYFQEVFGGADGTSLPLDHQGLLRAVETIALPGTKFEILEHLGSYIVRIQTRDYFGTNLFTDMRFLEEAHKDSPERPQLLPSKQSILHQMQSSLGAAYIWGGNWKAGIPQLLAFYPPGKELDQPTQQSWLLQGVDCSGLIYEATNGFTPRNTSELVHYGKEVLIEGKNPENIANLLQPLDLIAWKGHVIVSFDQENVIESRQGRGVVITNAVVRLNELMRERQPINDPQELNAASFVVRRWCS
jgi:hypothetical protein